VTAAASSPRHRRRFPFWPPSLSSCAAPSTSDRPVHRSLHRCCWDRPPASTSSTSDLLAPDPCGSTSGLDLLDLWPRPRTRSLRPRESATAAAMIPAAPPPPRPRSLRPRPAPVFSCPTAPGQPPLASRTPPVFSWSSTICRELVAWLPIYSIRPPLPSISC
jgi:hypothetical protein